MKLAFTKRITLIIVLIMVLLLALLLAGCQEPGGLKLDSGGYLEVTDLEDEEANELCDEVLREIIDKDMSQEEMARAIYDWVVDNIRYSGNTTKGNTVRGAKLALSKRTGDCYAFCSSLWALLSRAGIESQEVAGNRNYHFWVISNIEGNWYYLDATSGWGGERFMLTQKELEEYSYKNPKYDNPLTYRWDATKCPETP